MMRHAQTRTILWSLVNSFPLTLGLLTLFTACVSAPDHQDWIRVGVTTKGEVITRYGQPDLVIASLTGTPPSTARPLPDLLPHKWKFPPSRPAHWDQPRHACTRSPRV